MVVGMEGDLADGRITFDAFARHYYYSATEEGNTYIVTRTFWKTWPRREPMTYSIRCPPPMPMRYSAVPRR